MITAIFNNKGGTGKSTTAVNLAAAIAMQGSKVLIVDLDAQANATAYCGADAENEDLPSIFEVLFEGLDPRKAILSTACEGLFLLPANGKMKNSSSRLNQDPISNPAARLFLAFRNSKIENDFDYIFLDCPSELDTVTANALNASHDCIVPCITDIFSKMGLLKVLDALDTAANNGTGTTITLSGTVVCNFRGATKIARTNAEEIFEALPETAYRTIIRQSVAIPTSMEMLKPVVFSHPKSTAAQDYFSLAAEYILRHPALTSAQKHA